MTRMTRPDCVVMCNSINTHTHTTQIQTHNTNTDTPWEDQCEWHRMTINRMTGPDCAVMCNLINTHTRITQKQHTHTHTNLTHRWDSTNKTRKNGRTYDVLSTKLLSKPIDSASSLSPTKTPLKNKGKARYTNTQTHKHTQYH